MPIARPGSPLLLLLLPHLAVLGSGCAEDGGIRRVDTGFFSPGSIDFGARSIGEAHSAEVTLTNTSGGRLLIQRISSDPVSDAYSARQLQGGALTGVTLGVGQSLQVEVLFGPSEEIDYETKLILVTEELELSLDLKGEGIFIPPARPELNPQTLSWGQVELGRQITRQIMLTNRGERPGRLDRVEALAPFSVFAPDGSLAAPSSTLEPGDSIPLEVRFRPTRTGAFPQTIRFKMGEQEGALSVDGTGVEPGTLGCPAQIDLGQVPRGETGVQSVRCPIDGLFEIEEVRLATGGLFRLQNVTTSGALNLEVIFEAIGLPQLAQDTLIITGAHGGIVQVPIRAELVPPSPESTDLHIHVDWSTNTDFDLHLTRGSFLPFSNQDCHFGAKTLDWGAPGDDLDDPHLDQDATGGSDGDDETLNLINAPADTYNLYVHFYEAKTEPGPSQLRVDYRLRGGLMDSFTRTFDPGQCGLMWFLGTFDFQGASPSFTPVNMDEMRWMGRCQ